MPFQAFALMLLLPALVACSSISQPNVNESPEQPLLQALYSWSPALDNVDTAPPDESSTDNAARLDSPAQAQALALQQSPTIRSILMSQGIADADYRQATLISNPGFSASALREENSGSWKTEFGISFGILDWLTQPLRQTLAGAELESALTRALHALTRELGSIRNSYFAAVAARHTSRQQQQIAEAARLNAALARELQQAGNLSELERLRYDNELARQQLAVQQTQADADVRLAELKLGLGLSANRELLIPDALPDAGTDLLSPAELQTLMDDDEAFDTFLTTVSQQRPERRLLHNARTALAQRQRLQERTVGMSEIGLGFVTEREPDGSNASGVELDLSLPMFDRGQHRVASTQASLEQLTADEQALQLTIEHQLKIGLNNLLSLTRQLSQLRDEDIPRQQRMLDLVLQEYNFMLSGPFELISAKQAETETVIRYIGLLERYWSEYADLMQHSANTLEDFLSRPDTDSGFTAPSAPSPEPRAVESEPVNHQEHHHD